MREGKLSKEARSAGPRHWFVGEVIEWIAYGSTPLPILRPHPRWGYDPPQILMDVLAARAERRVWQPTEPPLYGLPYHYRANAKRIMRDMGLSAADAFQSLMDTKALAADEHRRLLEALSELNRAVEAAEINAEGRPTVTLRGPLGYRPYELIPTHLIDGIRTIDAFGALCISSDKAIEAWLHDNGPFFHDIRLLILDVKRHWPDRAMPKALPNAVAWMTQAAEEFWRKNKTKAKRSVLVQDCVKAVKCRYEDAEAAYKTLPSCLRRARGERK